MSTSHYLTLAEVAAYLGWTTRFVERLAVGGKLPGQEIDGQWRFRRDELVDWLDQKIQTLDTARVAEFEHRLETELEAEGILPKSHPAPLSEHLLPASIRLDLPPGSKAEILHALVDLAKQTGKVAAPERLLASLIEREALCSTAFPGGVAIVHPRRPLPEVLDSSVFAFARTSTPVAFGAEDGEQTQLFFLLASVDEREHLHSLARLVRVLRGNTLASLAAAPTGEAVINLIRQREADIDVKPPLVSDE